MWRVWKYHDAINKIRLARAAGLFHQGGGDKRGNTGVVEENWW